MTEPIVDNTSKSRFEQAIGEHLAVAEYVRKGDTIVFTHTKVPEHLEDQGIASGLARFALDKARAEGLKVDPQCPFIAGFIRKNPEYADLLVKR